MRGRLLFLVAILLLLTPPAAAKGKLEAKEAFSRAIQYYNLSEFQKALDGFKEAYLAYPDPSFLFNIGQCQRQLGSKQEALLSYKAYLREADDAPNREEVTTLVRNLERSIREDEVARHGKPEGALAPSEPAVTATSGVAASAPPRRKPVYKQWWLWTTVGVVVGLGVGLGVGLTRPTHYPASSPSDGTIQF
jgi:tetratricopeptide (TPR) repeat protein